MLALLKLIIFGHLHKWIDVGHGRWSRPEDSSEGPRYVCKCERCGAYKAFDL
jgi:hypothetical protein